jgi:hypothetical protein
VDAVVVAELEECPAEGCTYSVLLRTDDAAETVEWIGAPALNWGP